MIYKSKRAALLGRRDGAKGPWLDYWDFDTRKEFDAYLSGMYRAAGFEGSGNRGIRKHVRQKYGASL